MQDSHSAPLIARSAELSGLDRALTATAAGRGRLVLLLGEPGAGKSRLAHELSLVAADRGVRIIRGRCQPFESDIPLAPLRRRLADLPSSLPGVQRLRDPGIADPAADLRFVLVEAATAMLRQMMDSAPGPILFVLEDLHWSDPESLQVLQAVARHVATRPVLVVGCARLHPSPAGLRHLARQDGVHVQPVGPLDAEATEALLGALVGGALGPRLREQAARTGGIPFHVEHLAAELRRRGLRTVAGGIAEVAAPDGAAPDGVDPDRAGPMGLAAHLPDHLADHVADRLDVLTPLQRQLVQVAAVVEADLQLLADVAATDVPTVAAEAEAVIREGLLESHDGGRGLRIRHDLVREQIIAGMSDVVRAALHTQVARVLRDRDADLAVVAPHLLRSADGTDPRGLDDIVTAARELAATAPAVAAPLFERAHHKGVPGVGVELVATLIALGEIDRATEVMDQLATPADPALAVRHDMARAQLRFLAGDLLGAVHAFADVADAARLLPADARADVGAPTPASASAHGAVAAVLVGRLERAQAMALDACAADDGDGPHAATAIGLLVRGWVAAMRAQPGRGRALTTAGHRHATDVATLLTQAVQPDFFLGQAELWDERPAEAVRVALRGLERTRDLQIAWQGPALHATAALGLVRLARWDEARHQAVLGVERAAHARTAHGLPWCHTVLAIIGLGRGEDIAPVLDRAEAATEQLGGQGSAVLQWQRGVHALATGAPDTALDILCALWERMQRAGLWQRMLLIAPDLARTAAQVDPGLLDRLATWTTSPEAGRPRPRVTALQLQLDGLRTGRHEPLIKAGRLLLEVEDLMGGARLLADAVTLAGGPGERGVRDAAQRAATIFGQAGATSLLPLVLVDDPAPRRLRPTHGWASLTRSQERIVGLVARGLSNQEIADQLSVSRRTVESHLHQAYGKLGLGSRVELAVAAAARDDLGQDG